MVLGKDRVMIKRLILMIALLIGSSSFANENKDQFLKLIKNKSGEYKLEKKSHAKCSDGELTFVDENQEKGFRLGQNIFIGPFDDLEIEKTEDGCKVERTYSFQKDAVVETVKIFSCPDSLKKNEAQSTKTLSVSGDTVSFEIKETQFVCHFSRGK